MYPWVNAAWTTTRLIAASPFRYDRHPSFYVILDENDPGYGCWGDSGTGERGGFVQLLAFLRDETYEEAAEYLRIKYGGQPEDPDEITLTVPRLTLDKPKVTRIDASILDNYRFRHTYLEKRGITEEVQRVLQIGYDRDRQAVTLPWMNPDGSIGNVKYRRVDSKAFWYAKGARPIREMLYGIHLAYKQRIKRAFIVEAEIDALSLMSAGIYAVATGGAAFNAAKRDLLLRSPIEEVVLLRDNDAAGRTWRNRIIAELGGKMDVEIALVPRTYKDVNEWHCAEGLRQSLRHINTRKCRTMTVNFG
ncbi:DNA primase [Paenibacillus sp. BK033]|uniref:toprim domain-containing protein n=1 Tax=Paenibacillus sp. BK033 TaxID=2512133 RepID=UPI0010D90A67|nr:toprim domain-containing protein [Paenibacillus sp. BK033]TCM89654.1 DNA primase [Paenibacillus sp. BK033]